MFNPEQFLAQHNGDPLAALRALEDQRHEAQEGRDREGRAAQTARRERDTARSELDTAREELRTAQQQAAPAGAVILTGDDALTWQQVQERGGLAAWDADRQAAESGRTTERALTLTRAATALNVPEDALTEFLGDRAPTLREEQRDGQTVTVYGLGEGDAFRPLADMSVIRALQTQAAPTPTPGVPFPTQRPQPTPATPDPVQDYARRLLGTPARSTS